MYDVNVPFLIMRMENLLDKFSFVKTYHFTALLLSVILFIVFYVRVKVKKIEVSPNLKTYLFTWIICSTTSFAFNLLQFIGWFFNEGKFLNFAGCQRILYFVKLF